MTRCTELVESVDPEDLTPDMRAQLVELQRADFLRVQYEVMRLNAIRLMLSLGPVRVVKDRDTKKGEKDNAR